LGFNLVVSSGLETNTTMDQYIEWVLGRESTRVVALLLETARKPEGFSAALSRANSMEIPVVALKVGSSPRGKAAVTTHSEAIAGEGTTFQAVFDHYGVHSVSSPDELLDTIEVFNSPRRATAAGLGAVHDSGGERAMLIDIAHRVGVGLPDLSPATTARLEELLDPGLEAANPVDAWGTGRNAEGVFADSLSVLADDDSVGAVAFCVDLTAEERPDDAYSSATIKTLSSTHKPVVVIANLASAVDPLQARQLRSAGIPVLEGTETALRALGHLFDDWRYRSRPTGVERISIPQLLAIQALTETSSLQLLAEYGIEAAVSTMASSVDEAVVAAEAIGYPVVIKTAGISHKSDIMNDEGEDPKKGSLLVAPYGEGYYIYTGLSFFRELPAGVPGAYKLFANMLSIGSNAPQNVNAVKG
jgi:acyl-CoA synthetase (NDP forming)